MAIDKKIKYEMQGNEKPARNYLGKQKTVTVPVKWKSNPKAPKTELAYITKAEKDLLIKKDLHGSLKKGANTGPSGIMSLDSQGDYSPDRSPGSNSATSNSSDKSIGRGTRERAVRAEARMRDMMTGTGTTATSSGGDTYRSRNLYETPEMSFNTTTGKNEYIGSGQKFVGNPSLLNRIFGGVNKYGYRDIQNTKPGSGIFGTNYFGDEDITYNPVTQQYEHSGLNTGDVKPGMGGKILGGLASILTGVPLVGGFIGNQIDKFKPKSYMEKQTPEQISRMKGLQMINGELVDTRMLDFDPNAQIQKPTNVPMDTLGPYNKPINNTSYTGGSIDFNPGMTTMYGNGITQTQPFGNPDKFTSDLAPNYQDMAVNIGLTKQQKEGLDSKAANVKSGLFSVGDAYNSIKPFDDKEDPATLKEVKEYYGLPV